VSWVTGVAAYVVIWWVVLFAVLPWGVQQETEPQPGFDRGAPRHPHLVAKAIATTLVSGAIWLAFFAASWYGLIDFRAMMR
jgi:predicted secreted protein